jgi:hypothetical protein
MKTETFNRRLVQLTKEVENHPYRDELLKLINEQLLDDNA